MKLARKLAFAFIVGMGAVLALHALLQIRREAAFYEADTQGDHLHFGRAIALAVQKIAADEGEAAALRFIGRVNEAGNPVHVRWLRTKAAGDNVPPGILSAVGAGSEVFRVDSTAGLAYTFLPIGADGGVLELSESLEEQQRYSRSSLLQVLATTSVIALLAAGLAFVLGAWLVGRPIKTLIDVARRIGAGDLSRRVDLGHGDEIGELALEMNAMADRLAATLEKLRQADRLATVGKLAACVAHEFGTPLSVILGRTEMMVEGAAEKGSDIAEDARIVAEQAQRMSKIIRQLLEFAHPRKPDKDRADLRELVKGTIHMLGPVAGKRGVSLALTDSDEPASASVDAGQIQQVLANLIMNGVQAMPGGGRITVSLAHERARRPAIEGEAAADQDGDCVRIDIEDEGEGMPEAVQRRLFEPFFTTKEPGQGTGLGLSVSRGIVHEHGGWITVRSKPGAGSCFSIHLPAQEVTACLTAS